MQTSLKDCFNCIEYRCLDSNFTPLAVHLLSLLVVGVFFANVQITTRLVCSASPLVYVGLVDLLSKGPMWRRRLCLGFLVLYNVAGVLLHTNFYPWT
mmetsp:Transcript_731/g.1006  ORF Transcript_731/g.1006 Transcript_731/m.1006 type:complete len:97 (+) Transcript_731:1-291(+)